MNNHPFILMRRSFWIFLICVYAHLASCTSVYNSLSVSKPADTFLVHTLKVDTTFAISVQANSFWNQNLFVETRIDDSPYVNRIEEPAQTITISSKIPISEDVNVLFGMNFVSNPGVYSRNIFSDSKQINGLGGLEIHGVFNSESPRERVSNYFMGGVSIQPLRQEWDVETFFQNNLISTGIRTYKTYMVTWQGRSTYVVDLHPNIDFAVSPGLSLRLGSLLGVSFNYWTGFTATFSRFSTFIGISQANILYGGRQPISTLQSERGLKTSFITQFSIAL